MSGVQSFRLEKESSLTGEYLAVVLVQNFDGGFIRKYAPFAIQ
jgi:hypothetical protein